MICEDTLTYMGVLMDVSFFDILTSYLNHLSLLQGYFLIT